MTIKVRIKNIYGNQAIYPVCEKAALFANIAGSKTLTSSTVKLIKDLGYTIEVIHDVVSL